MLGHQITANGFNGEQYLHKEACDALVQELQHYFLKGSVSSVDGYVHELV